MEWSVAIIVIGVDNGAMIGAKFRFRLRTLLLLPAFFAFGWYWITWPSCTLDAFVDASQKGRVQSSGIAIVCVDCVADFKWPASSGEQSANKPQLPIFRHPCLTRGVYACRRRTIDLLLARQVFLTPRYGDLWPSFRLVVVRGSISIENRKLKSREEMTDERVRY